jgi:nicotinamidase-related amidase
LTCKGAERITKLLERIVSDPTGKAASEPPEIAFNSEASNGEYKVLKHPGTVSGLKSTEAADILTKHEIKSIIICGLSTSGAVLRTAVPTSDDGFIVSVIEDACADQEALHETLMKSVLPSRAHVAKADEFMKEWSKAKVITSISRQSVTRNTD